MKNLEEQGHLITEQVNLIVRTRPAKFLELIRFEIPEDAVTRSLPAAKKALAGRLTLLQLSVTPRTTVLCRGGRQWAAGVLDLTECPPTFCTPRN